MTDAWSDLIYGDQWRSAATLWVQDDTEYSWAQVAALAAAIEDVIREHGAARVVRIRSGSKLGCFAGQLAAWRAGCVAVADDGKLGPSEIDHVRPDLTVVVRPGETPMAEAPMAGTSGQAGPPGRIPGEVVAVNFTSGTTGSRKAVAVTRGNLLALVHCRDLAEPVAGRAVAGSFATPTYDGWWFDTWYPAAAGGTIVCLPSVNDDVFAWPELAQQYQIGRLLLPAAVIATIIEVVPSCIAGIPTVLSGGEQFQAPTYRQARRAGLANRFVNLYGPTEATFATHRYDLPETLASATIPIGRPLDGCSQALRDPGGGEPGGGEPGSGELVVSGPLVCLGYLEKGALARRFRDDGGRPWFRTGDLVRTDCGGNLVYAGRLDSQIKVNGMRVDVAALEREVTGLPGVLDCRVVRSDARTVAFVRADAGQSADAGLRSRVESVVLGFSPAIGVSLLDGFPVKPGGKVDTLALLNQYCMTDKDGEKWPTSR